MMTRWLAILCVLVMAVTGCPKKNGTASQEGGIAADDTSGVVVKDSSEGLLLTWIDDKGDFHVEQKVTDVPLIGRDSVRVVDPNKDEGTHDGKIFVADLRTARPDGTYAVHAMTRADFDALALARRQKHGPTLASAFDASAVPVGGPDISNSSSAPNAPVDPSTQAPVIIYGAEWCGACHQAAAYLRGKGIAFVEKDIEKDSAAAREMQRKLTRFGLRGGSIPVIDVHGKVMVGFNSHEIDEALGKAT